MSIKTVVIGTLGLGILITAMAVALSFVSEDVDCASFLLNVIDLRDKVGDPVGRAKFITSIDESVKHMNNDVISEAWGDMLSCLQEKCASEDYLNFVIIVVDEKKDELPESALISNIIVAHRFWGDENIVEFSKALTDADAAVQQMHSKNVAKKWDEIVACNGVCAEKDALFFELLKLVIES